MEDSVAVTILILFVHFLLLNYPSSSLPLCSDSRAPHIPKRPLVFCPYNGSVCCDSAKDLQLQKQFHEMNISDPGCATLVKSTLCSRCDQFSAQLFKVESGPQAVPVLCSSTLLRNSSLSNKAPSSFCSTVWDACQNVSILNSPFAPSLQGRGEAPVDSSPSKLNKLWQSKSVFCDAFGGSSDNKSICFNGEQVSLEKTETVLPPMGMCLEKIGNGSYLNMVAHPDGSNSAFFSDQSGKIWLATIPEQSSGATLGLDMSRPFMDLSDRVFSDSSFGMMGMAFHPNFAQNGRFFASFNCDKVKTPGCSGRCACNTDVDCDPSKIGSSNAAQPCRYHKVIAEFTANGTSGYSASPIEVRRVFTLGLPFAFNHAGQILFGPADGYLYVMMGDGGKGGDPYYFSQNKKSLLGKILRLDIDNLPSADEIGDLGLWGNYSVPQDNPSSEDKDLQPEIWALGLRNPWRCSFDSERSLYFVCADTGQDHYEEVDIITKGGNYGWSVFEGPFPYNPHQSPANSTNPIFPVLGYNHSDVNDNEGSAAISGGYFYRSLTDPCMFGSYLYADLYGSAIWAAAESPANSGNFTSAMIPFSCAHDSPIHCSSIPGNSLPALGYIYSFGEDNRKDIFILASSGVYRVVRPSHCNYTCSKENVTAIILQTPSSGNQLTNFHWMLFLSLSFLGFLLSTESYILIERL
ncbi:HIPL1 protein-like [Juglans microcarpa x Juglans regia]|uniref:HIPL1 protein-like n=1 Tax=Juglans microcarpa x Juglans regia TaxID=2249226 RepID=UPI001B7E9233|nr:HIPL1 protein-like [Juglans microcarpa x Juglans regia]